jgi:hypothetical protein
MATSEFRREWASAGSETRWSEVQFDEDTVELDRYGSCAILTIVPEIASRWLVLIHQIPPRPGYLRVKVGRRLQSLGAVPVKNSVYVLPASDQALEDFQWVRREIVAGAGDATVCEARFVLGLSDTSLEALFVAARESDYAELAKEARRLLAAAQKPRRRAVGEAAKTAGALGRLRRRLAEVAAIDFFLAPGRETVEGLLSAVEAALRPVEDPAAVPVGPAEGMRGRVWVTRSGVQVDRIASAWLIRRFIDPEPRFKLVDGHGYEPQPGELRFDMFEAEFTHEGDLCTFEVLVRRFGRRDRGLRHLAEIVHDIDLKDGKFVRPEAAGLERLLAGLALRHADDESRLAEGGALMESLYEYFHRKGTA